MMKNMLYAAPLLLLSVFSHAEQSVSQWQAVTGSDSKDFQIHCWNGNAKTLIIGKDNVDNEYQLARNIYFLPQASSSAILMFKRGFVRADTNMTYIPSGNERCEITEQ